MGKAPDKLWREPVLGLGPSHPLPSGSKWPQRAENLKRRSMIPSSLTMTQLPLCLSRDLAGKGALLSPKDRCPLPFAFFSWSLTYAPPCSSALCKNYLIQSLKLVQWLWPSPLTTSGLSFLVCTVGRMIHLPKRVLVIIRNNHSAWNWSSHNNRLLLLKVCAGNLEQSTNICWTLHVGRRGLWVDRALPSMHLCSNPDTPWLLPTPPACSSIHTGMTWQYEVENKEMKKIIHRG